MGYKIKEMREDLRMTQEELATKSGVSRGTIIALENDEDKNVTTTTLCKLANALGTTVEQLFFGTGV